MIRKLVLLTASVSLAALGCPARAADPAPAPDFVAPTYPGWGVNPADLDPAVKPGDDFNAFVNGRWDAKTEIPPQYPLAGPDLDLTLGAQHDLRQVIADLIAANPAPGTLDRRIVDAYSAYLDVPAINAAGLAPAKPWLDAIAAAGSHDALIALMARPGYPGMLALGVGSDPNAPDTNTVSVNIAGIGLPDRDNYLIDSPRNRDMQAQYRDYVAFMLGKAGITDPAAPDQVLALEKQVAAVMWDRTIARNPIITNNPMTGAQLIALSGHFPMASFLGTLGLTPADSFNPSEIPLTPARIAAAGLTPEQVAKLGGGIPALLVLLQTAPLPALKAWMVVHFLTADAGVLPSEIDNARFAFYGTYLAGSKAQRPRDQRAVSFTEGALGEALGKAYVARNFSAASKAEMLDLVHNLLTAMKADLADLSWMTPDTRKEALTKLAAFRVKVGYPDKFETYDGMDIRPGQALGNVIAAEDWAWKKQLSDLRKPVDKAKWHMTPQTVNAYYSAVGNEIVFPAAYLQPPNFNPKADPAVNYGAIGSTIGHEIGHGFDDQGSRYDGTGALRNWWTEQDHATFAKLGEKLAAQYDAYCPFDAGKTCVNGHLTMGENIGDLGGLSIAYRAYKLSLHGRPAPVIDGFTGDQRFFIAYAQKFRGKWREAFQRQIMQTDPHSPDTARVNLVLRNFDPWYEAFHVRPGDKLYLPPEQRVHIW
jgi:putative endopeptidase